MKWLLNIIGILLILVGIVWILQGVNVLAGSMMSGHIQYSIIGLVVAALGVLAMVFANRRGRVAR